MTAQELKELSASAESLKKRTAMKYAESLKMEKFYNLLKTAASLGKTHVSVAPHELGEDGYDVAKIGRDEFDMQHFLILTANKIESEIQGIQATPDANEIYISWGV